MTLKATLRLIDVFSRDEEERIRLRDRAIHAEEASRKAYREANKDKISLKHKAYYEARTGKIKRLKPELHIVGTAPNDEGEEEEDPDESPLITVTPHTRANRVMDLETLSRAILNLHEGMEEKQARDTALHVLEFFGYNDYAYANALAPDDNSVFYHLEDLGLLGSTSETIQLLNNGREWRVFQWVLRKDRIIEAATAERKPESGVYETIPQEAWNR